MSYPRRNKFIAAPVRERRQRLVVGAGVLVLFVALLAIPAVHGFFLSIAGGIWGAESAVVAGSTGTLSLLQSKRALVAENTRLRAELEEAKTDYLLVGILERENADLKRSFGRDAQEEGTALLATVLIKPPRTPYDTLVLDAGEDKGVKVGDKVMLHAVALGEVDQVFQRTSRVLLYSAPGRSTPVLIGEDGIQVDAIGRGGGTFEVRTPKEIGVAEGDAVYLPSLSPSVFGSVESVESADSDAFQRVLFKVPVNISTLKWVEIHTKE